MDWYAKRVFQRLHQRASEIIPDLEAVADLSPEANQRLQMLRWTLDDAAVELKKIEQHAPDAFH